VKETKIIYKKSTNAYQLTCIWWFVIWYKYSLMHGYGSYEVRQGEELLNQTSNHSFPKKESSESLNRGLKGDFPCITNKKTNRIYILLLRPKEGTRWRSWLRHFATSRKVAGSIPDRNIDSFD